MPDPQAMPDMQKRVEQLHGKKVGPWNISCNVYHAKQAPTPPTVRISFLTLILETKFSNNQISNNK
jgi:hypothetical protein